jgi:hypothetical protein
LIAHLCEDDRLRQRLSDRDTKEHQVHYRRGNDSREARRKTGRPGLAGTALAAMGVVFGDIGTSPLYTVKEVFGGHHPLPILNAANVLGILSLVFWALTITVSLKYVLFIMRADNKGEGGIMALTALALRTANASPRVLWMMSALGIFGAALFYGDAVITPAMSVLSAVEGLDVATPLLTPYVLPITVCILVVTVRLSAPRHGGRRGAVRPGDDVLVHDPRHARLVERDPVSVGAGGDQSLVCRGVCHRTSGHGFPGAGFGGAGDYRWRSALRRHGPLRSAGDQVGLVCFRLSAALSQLSWPGGADPEGSEAQSRIPSS